MKPPKRNLSPGYVQRIRGLRKTASLAEKKMWYALRKEKTGFRFRRQHPIGRYALDFYCPETRVCVEVDGDQHLRTLARDAVLEQMGIVTCRVPADAVFADAAEHVFQIRQLCVARTSRTPGTPANDEPL